MTSVADEPQTSLYEKVVEDEKLEAALEARDELRVEASEANKAYREATDKVKALADWLEMGDGAAVRVGRFVITRRAIAARSVAFETAARSQYSFAKLEAAE